MRVHRNMFEVAVLLVAITMTSPAVAQDPCSWSADVRLINGKIYTMDSKNSVVDEVTIQDGKVAYLGKLGSRKVSPCTKVIDLRGRAAVPGLIDGHNHFASVAMAPGYDVRLETAWSIADIQKLIQAKVKTVPAGALITTMQGWNPIQLKEKREPTMAELDQAAPNNPYYSSIGPVMNSRAKAYLEGKGLKLTAAGKYGEGTSLTDVYRVLRADQTVETMKRGILGVEAYWLSVGLVTNIDGGFPYLAGSPDLKDASAGNHGLEVFNPWTVFNPWLELNREGKLKSRMRFYWYGQDTRPDIPLLTEHLNHNAPYMGDDMVRFSGIGERPVSWSGGGGAAAGGAAAGQAAAGAAAGQAPAAGQRGGQAAAAPRTSPPDNFEAALMLIAKHGWSFIHHAIQANESKMIMETMERVNKVYPIANLRWSLLHTADISDDTLNRLKAMGAGVQPNAYPYISAVSADGAPAGPPFRRILDNGIRVTGGSGCGMVCGMNPWLMIYYMVTGRNSAGEMKNAGQQITRMEALRLYTSTPPWFFKEEDKLGSIEVGKLGDVAVLSADYTDPAKVPDLEIRNLTSVLTVVGGKVVWDTLNNPPQISPGLR